MKTGKDMPIDAIYRVGEELLPLSENRERGVCAVQMLGGCCPGIWEAGAVSRDAFCGVAAKAGRYWQSKAATW